MFRMSRSCLSSRSIISLMCVLNLLLLIGYMLNRRISGHGILNLFNWSKRPPVMAAAPSWHEFYDYIEMIQPCNKSKYFGGIVSSKRRDGNKLVCLDGSLGPDEGGDCRVLSFGIKKDFSFDNAMHGIGCTVHSFDPTNNGMPSHQRGANHFFHRLGLDYNSTNRISRQALTNTSGPMESYRGILAMVDWTDSVIDYLKMDIEGSERGFFQNVLFEDSEILRNVKQIGVEIHPLNLTPNRDLYWRYLHRLEMLKFRLVSSEPNFIFKKTQFEYEGRQVSCCYEMLLVNELYL